MCAGCVHLSQLLKLQQCLQLSDHENPSGYAMKGRDQESPQGPGSETAAPLSQHPLPNVPQRCNKIRRPKERSDSMFLETICIFPSSIAYMAMVQRQQHFPATSQRTQCCCKLHTAWLATLQDKPSDQAAESFQGPQPQKGRRPSRTRPLWIHREGEVSGVWQAPQRLTFLGSPPR